MFVACVTSFSLSVVMKKCAATIKKKKEK